MFKKSQLFITALIFCTSFAWASTGDKQKVQSFYDFLSNPGSAEHAKAFASATSDDWLSIGGYSGNNKNT